MSNDNPYAQFGVHNAVLTSDNIEDHRQNMLAADVDVRDHDDQIVLANDESDNVAVTDLVDDPLATDDLVKVDIPDGEVQTNNLEPEADTDEGDADAKPEGDFTALGDVPDDLTAAAEQITQYADGFAEMKAGAIARGLTAEAAAKVEAEYQDSGELSEESLKALEEAGYGRGFVQSYIKGQESLAEQYVARVMDYAGGKESYGRISAHLAANAPEALEALEDAIQRQDLKAVKATINLAMASQTKKFGTAPARSVTKAAPAVAAKPATTAPKGFASTNEMVTAMSDPRYAKDPSYRAAVQAKVAASNW